MKLARTHLMLAAALAAAGCAATAPQAPIPLTLPPAFPRAADQGPAPDVTVTYDLTEDAYHSVQKAYQLAQATSRRVIVKATDDALAGLEAAGLGRLVSRLPALEAAVLDVAPGDIDAALDALRAVPGVTYAERDGISLVGVGSRWTTWPSVSAPVAQVVSAPAATQPNEPNDPRFGSQWAYGPIAALNAWGAALTAAAPPTPITIAILDTGIDQNHEDLDPTHSLDDQRGRLWRDVNFSDSTTVDDRFGHGTHVAGVAAASTNNNIGVAGMFPSARLMNVKVIGDNGIGYDSGIAAGIRWAVDHGAQVLNMSFSQSTDATLVREAVAYAASKGVVMIAAAGNEGSPDKRYPAAYPQVIAVGATSQPLLGRPEKRADFSNYGASWVDVAAPGEGIVSTLPNHDSGIKVKNYGSMSGTSMAAPIVAAEAAMLWQANGGDAKRIRARIEGKSDTDVAGSRTAWAYGRINMERALSEP